MSSLIAVSKVVVGSNYRTISGVPDISSVVHEELPAELRTEIEELAGSIKEHGLLQPIVVKDLGDGKKFRLLAGWRRFMACRFLGMIQIDAKSMKGKTEDEHVLSLAENVHRKDLPAIDVARALDDIKRIKGLTRQEDLAEYIGKSTAWVSYHLNFLKADKEVQNAVSCGEVGTSAARHLTSLPKHEQNVALTKARESAKANAKPGKKPKVTAREAKRQVKAAKKDKKDNQITIPAIAQREQEQKDEVLDQFYAEALGGKRKVSTEVKDAVGKFWDFLFEHNRLVIKK